MPDRFATFPDKASSGGKKTTQIRSMIGYNLEGTFFKKVLPNSVIQYNIMGTVANYSLILARNFSPNL